MLWSIVWSVINFGALAYALRSEHRVTFYQPANVARPLRIAIHSYLIWRRAALIQANMTLKAPVSNRIIAPLGGRLMSLASTWFGLVSFDERHLAFWPTNYIPHLLRTAQPVAYEVSPFASATPAANG